MSLRIALTADPYLPVPPTLYGGIERIIDFLARGLIERGHEVVLFAHPGSHIPGSRLVPYGSPPHSGWRARGLEVASLGLALWRHRNKVDIVHSFGRLAALAPVLPLRHLPKIQSYQRPVPWQGVTRAVRLAGGSLCLTACSSSLYRGHAGADRAGACWRTIYNGVDISRYAYQAVVGPDAPLVYLGKIEPMKGVHLALEIAARAGRRLIVAGNHATSGPDAEYFAHAILPHVDGRRVEFVGSVDDQQKSALLGTAAALLFPTLYAEAFGIVMAEAMACGTPVIGFAHGGVPEVITDGVNGFLCTSVDEAVQAVHRLPELERETIRRDCEARFSSTVLVDQYLALYRERLA